MEIKRINDSQVRCAITEQEIMEMGFNIDEIIGNTEETQKFMRVLLEKIEEQESIDVDLLSPMVRAELLQDHSMTITFGGITEEEKRSMFDKVLDMMERLSDKKGSDDVSKPVKKGAPSQGADKNTVMEKTIEQTVGEPDIFMQKTPYALEFQDMNTAIRLSKLFLGQDKIPQSEYYKMNGKYYLLMELKRFSKARLRPFAFAAVEYSARHIASETGVSYVREHGTCILKKDAIRTLMQL